MEEKKPANGRLVREHTGIRIDLKLKNLLQEKAKQMGTSFNSAIIYYLRKGLELE